MPRHRPTLSLIYALATVTALTLTLAGCTFIGGSKTDLKKMDAIAAQIETTLAQRPDVVKASVVYQDNIEASQVVNVSLTVKAGTDFDPVIDATLRLLWQSQLTPLNDISIDVIDEHDLQRGTVRHIIATTDKADLNAKYGTRPVK